MDILHIKKAKGEFFKILGETERSQVGVMTLGPGEDSGKEETHKGDQVVYVIEGRAHIQIGDKEEKLHECEALIIPAKTRHHIYNKGMETLFIFTVYAPPSY